MTDEHAAYLRDMTEYLAGILSTDEIGELVSAADRIEALTAELDLTRKALAVKDSHDHFDCAAERARLEIGLEAERALADQLAAALRLTQEYVGIQTLPDIEGWSHFDARDAYLARRSPKEPT